MKNVLGRTYKKFQRGQHSEMYLLTLKEQDKTKMKFPHDTVSISASSCRTKTEPYRDIHKWWGGEVWWWANIFQWKIKVLDQSVL